jgi:uncharacterized protein
VAGPAEVPVERRVDPWDDVAVTALEDLLVLQALDLRIQQLHHKRSTLPEIAAGAANAAEQAALATEVADAEARHRELVREQKRLEDEIALVTERAGKHEANLYSGSVTNPRELQALQDDIDALRRRQRALEDDDLEIMEALEPVTAELEELAGRRATLDAAAADIEASLASSASDIDTELATLTAERSEAAAAIAPSLLDEYESLRAQFGGIGVARLEGSTCGGCRLSLSAVEVDRIRKLDPDERVLCEECGRLLVR